MRRTLALSALAAAFCAAAPANAACELAKIAELPVEMDGARPLIRSEINGQKVFLVANTSNQSTSIGAAAAKRLGLGSVSLSNAEFVDASGKREAARLGRIEELKLGQLSIKNVDVLVGGDDYDRADVAGSLGLGQYAQYEIELDFGGGAIRFFKAKDCGSAELIYWEGAYTVAPLLVRPRFETEIKLNGKRVPAALSTGNTFSAASLSAARASGVTPTSPGVVLAAKAETPEAMDTWVATFDTFSIGDEAISKAKVRIGDFFGKATNIETGSRVPKRVEDLPTMMLGADFFRSHRVLISPSQGKLYLSYQGGPVFQVAGAPPSK